MKISVKDINRKLVWIITLFMFVTLYIFDNGSWGNYILGICAAAIFFFGGIISSRRYQFSIKPFYLFVFFFAFFCLASAVWAWHSDIAISQSRRIFLILIFFGMIYFTYEHGDTIDPLMNCIMWGGYIVMIYAFYAYGGISAIMIMLSKGLRPTEEMFINVNVLGMLGAIACIIQVYKIVYEKKIISSVFMIPSAVIIATTQSKKAIIMLVIGTVLVVLSKNASSKKTLKFFKVVAAMAVLIFIGNYIINLDVFSGLKERMEEMFSTLLGSNTKIDSSTTARLRLVEIGMEQFWKNPFLGIGIGSSGDLVLREYGMNTYLHNNYIELLACGGIVGFLIYYSMYGYLVYNLIKYRKYDQKRADFCILLIIVLLITDYGYVSYSVKVQYFYLMMFFVQVEILKRNKKTRSADQPEKIS